METPVFTTKAKKEYLVRLDILPNNVRLPVVGERAYRIISEYALDDIQAFDVCVQTEQEEINVYKLLNITTKIQSINFQASRYRIKDGSKILYVQHLVLNEDCMGSAHLARDTDSLGYILVSPELREAFKKAKIKGAKFCTPKECGLAN